MTQALRQTIFELFDRIQINKIKITPHAAVEPTAVGRSKIGGTPDLPKGFAWPYYEAESFDGVRANRPLSFLAQINLAQASVFDRDCRLPREGVLSFFYELQSQKWGFDLGDKGCARVFYFSQEADLVNTDCPKDLEQDACLPTFSLSFESVASLPTYSNFCELPQAKGASDLLLHQTQSPWDVYDALKAAYGCPFDDEWAVNTHLLGYPDVIQNPMERECEKVTRGIYNGEPHLLSPELEADILKASSDWTLLFQMGTLQKDDFELMFGDCGHIYFWIKKEELRLKNFNNVWLILQCG